LATYANVENISPDMAADLLTRNLTNRTIRPARISRYAALMLADKWRLNGEAIVVDEHNNLMDGQHRLHAIVESGCTVPMVVSRNVPHHFFDTLGQGAARSFADVLQIQGSEGLNTRVLAAATTFVRLFTEGKIADLTKGMGYDNAEMAAFLRSHHPRLMDSAKFMEPLPHIKGFFRLSHAVGLHYLMARRARADSNEFWSQLMKGDNLIGTDPVFVLRQRLLDSAAKPYRRVPDIQRVGAAVKAWNMRRTGQQITGFAAIMFRWGKEVKEQMPVIL
jgi:hypothetical protein